MKWAKDRALELLDGGDRTGAYASMASDMGKHNETQGHPAIMLGMTLMVGGHLGTDKEMRDFIEGCN
jgi:hypothetical protein